MAKRVGAPLPRGLVRVDKRLKAAHGVYRAHARDSARDEIRVGSKRAVVVHHEVAHYAWTRRMTAAQRREFERVSQALMKSHGFVVTDGRGRRRVAVFGPRTKVRTVAKALGLRSYAGATGHYAFTEEVFAETWAKHERGGSLPRVLRAFFNRLKRAPARRGAH